jgi:hypothetical protein
MQMTMNLESLVQSPTPLPYLQHCRLLFIIFVIAHPLSMDASSGFCVNVVLSLTLFWAIRGFQVLSKRLENPMGNDEADLNLYDKLHSLEVSAEHAFDISADTTSDIRGSLRWTEQWVATGQTSPVAPPPLQPCKKTRTFRNYFRWMPIPTIMLRHMMESHGEVEIIHARRWTFAYLCCCIHGTRQALRRVLWRMDGDRLYQAVDPGDEDDKHFNSDPRFFCHYLEFIGSLKAESRISHGTDGCAESALCDKWLRNATHLLGRNPACSLLSKVDDEDTERSNMMQPLRALRTPSVWEHLS